ncbi:MAG: ATP-binding protein [Verrucomicrobiota bacterium]
MSAPAAVPSALPAWAGEIAALYESHAASQFVLHGNVQDSLLLPGTGDPRLGKLDEYVLEVLIPQFEVVLTYDLGGGLRVARGQQSFASWPSAPAQAHLMPRAPREAIDLLTHYARYVSNVRRAGGATVRIAFILRDAHLAIPALPGGLNYDLNAMALQVKTWASETLLTEHPFATFLFTENLNDLHPLIARDPRSFNIRVPLPPPSMLEETFRRLAPKFPLSLGPWRDRWGIPATQLAGATLVSIESLLKTKEHQRLPISENDLSKLKKELVEKDCQDLIEFIETSRTLDDLHGQEAVKEWLRQDLGLWRQNDSAAMPMGYLFCGPVGTGKTYMVECLAGEAGVPVVKLKNFRDRWVGSTEGNLEKIFRLLQALGKCYVFIDEADQALGKRNSDGDSGIGGRVYSMMAKEMSNSANRGRIVWILASSRPDLIEVDLKRPGRVDVKIPLFPTLTAEEGFGLLRALCKKRGTPLDQDLFETLRPHIPNWLTPGAAESLAVRIYRLVKTKNLSAADAALACLTDYQPAVPQDIMQFQIDLAVNEATDLSFVPTALRPAGRI